jgi:hypothetical protein
MRSCEYCNTRFLDLSCLSEIPSIRILPIIKDVMIQTIQCLKKQCVPVFSLTSERHLSSALSCQRTSLQSWSIKGTRYRTVMSSSWWTCTPKIFPLSGLQLLDPSLQLEEESLPTYCPEKYYPVRQGEVFNDRYQILAKLDYSITSAFWFGLVRP